MHFHSGHDGTSTYPPQATAQLGGQKWHFVSLVPVSYQTVLRKFSHSVRWLQILVTVSEHAFSVVVIAPLKKQRLVLGGGGEGAAKHSYTFKIYLCVCVCLCV